MKIKKIEFFLYFFLFFLFGFLLALFITRYPFIGLTGYAVNVPSDFLEARDILVYGDRVVIKVDNAVVNSYDSSISMSPLFGQRANGISIKPKSPEEIKVGDVVTFRKNGEILVHRIVEKGIDGEGIYFITKGDNNNFSDGKMRFEDVEYVLVAVVY